MPLSAIATGCVDFVVPLDGIAAELLRIAARFAGGGDDTRDDEAFERILTSIRRGTGVDFGNYKVATLRRRVQRRAILRRVGSLQEYADLVASDPSEAETLSEEVLIHVTSFFRDPDVFAALTKHILPRLVERGRDGGIRVWVPGCSTGEEVYSMAICLSELLAASGAAPVPIKMFGTDVSRRAIERARRGVYPESIADDVSPERLARFFVKTERGYEIVKELRDRCVFATHDVARDPPFSKMDVISCRNLMIYLDSALQQRVLSAFHYAMNEPGFLVLGTAETVGSFVGFTSADSKNKIFARSPGPVRLSFDFGNVREWPVPTHAFARSGERVTSADDVHRDASRAILSAIAPAGVVVTDDLAIIEFRGDMAAYLEPVPGVATLDLLRMAREELRLTLRRTIGDARTSGKRSRAESVPMGLGAELRSVDVDVVPFNVAPANARFFAVIFTERASTVAAAGPIPSDDVAQLAAAAADTLRKELASTRDYLQSVIEQLEGNEELKAANEEIVSSNEELQSTNEDLRTVNDEMLDRNVETTRLADDLSNVLSSVAIPILIFGRDSRIRRFTPAAKKVLGLRSADVDRPFADVQAKIGIPDLAALLADVLERLAHVERAIQFEDGRWYQLSGCGDREPVPLEPHLRLHLDLGEGLRGHARLDEANTELTDLEQTVARARTSTRVPPSLCCRRWSRRSASRWRASERGSRRTHEGRQSQSDRSPGLSNCRYRPSQLSSVEGGMTARRLASAGR